MYPLLASPFGMQDWVVLAVLGLLLFGARKLPEFGRSLGKGIVEFKKGLKGLEDDTEGGTGGSGDDGREPQAALPRPPQRVTPSGPRFENAPTDKPATHS